MAAKHNDNPSPDANISLRALLAGKTTHMNFTVWIVGDTPLITHAWSEKAKREMLQKQVKAVKRAGREARDPQEDFVNSLYEIGDNVFGFPTMAVKRALIDAAHKDKGVARTVVQDSLWLDCHMAQVRPALAGAVCTMPISRIWGAPPQMREDMVRVGTGLNKTASLAYRGQFWPWAIRITGRFNSTALPAESLAFLLPEAGKARGIGEWRNERNGVFGSFHPANEAEELAWSTFAAGKGPLPSSDTMEAME